MLWFPILAVLTVASIAAVFVIHRRHVQSEPAGAPRLNRVLRVSLIAAALLAGVGTMLLLGIPGAVFLELVNALFKRAGRDPLRLMGDGVWPMALLVSIVWPWLLPLGGVWFATARPRASSKVAYLVGLLLALLWGLLVSALLLAVH